MTERSVADALTLLSAYRAVDAAAVTANTNPQSIPADVRVTDGGGVGPRMRLLIYGDRNGLCVRTALTDSPVTLKVTTYANLPTFEIVTSERGVKPRAYPTFTADRLSYRAYTSILSVLKEMVAAHDLPLEWSACWVLRNRHSLRLYDSYIPSLPVQPPTLPGTSTTLPSTLPSTQPWIRCDTPGSALIALEGYNVGVYLPGTTPRMVSTLGGSAERSQPVDAIPVPVLYIRRSTQPTAEDGSPRYYACSGEGECEKAVRLFHFRIKDEPEVKMRKLDASNVARLVERMLQTHLVMPLPYLKPAEVERMAEILHV
jgi:hypothetical protein